jgi:hypothetical protein
MQGIDPYMFLNQVASNMDRYQDREEIETALDQVEYLFEVIPPELQHLAEPIVEALRVRLAEADTQ